MNTKTNLNGANLTWAKLNNADLRDTTFYRTILKGADLRFAQNLTPRELGEAITDSSTQLPEYLLEES
ncbi:MAG: pentapeptide repeat-containing protein [Nitrospinae bacterium]|nr:pentapeptide repeat-containing protein [Nitrospinota bacterium]